MTSSVNSLSSSHDGVTVHEISHGRYAIKVLPERGARVVSLRHGEHGEWLASSGRSWPDTPPTQWAHGDVRGWDECLPNIAPGNHPELGTELADHGEVWNRAWDWQTTPTGIRTRIGGKLMPFEFQRTLSLSPSGISARYSFKNISGGAYSIGWAMHLLLRGQPKNLVLPEGVPVRVDSSYGLELKPRTDEWVSWGELRGQLPMNTSGWALKMFTRAGAIPSIGLIDEGELMTVSISDTPIPPTFGLWINAGGWPADDPVAHIGIEPGFGEYDALGAAVRAGATLSTQPGVLSSWTVSLQTECIQPQPFLPLEVSL